jgi:RNA polymerase sigma factor (sigma-70 family)
VAIEESHAPPSLDTLYRSQWAGLVRLGWLMTGSREDAEDIVQEAFLALGRSLPTVASPKAYLHRCVVNLVRARARHQRVVERHPPDQPRPVLPPELDETWRLVDRLPARQRHALVLRYYDDMSIDEIAQHLGCRVGTVKSLIHRGLRKLEPSVR